MITALVLALLVAATPPLPTFFVPPKGCAINGSTMGLHRAALRDVLSNGSFDVPSTMNASGAGQVPARVYFRRELILQG